MTPKKELQRWLDTLPEDAQVGVDEGGLTLVTDDRSAYLEIGGVPEEESDAEPRFSWRVTNVRTNESCVYTATAHTPVTAEHVRTSPAVLRWAAGDPIKVSVPSYLFDVDEV